MVSRALAFAALSACAVAESPVPAATHPYLWEYRPMVVFASDAANVVAAEGAAFRERDVAVVYVIRDSVSQEFGPAPGVASTLRPWHGARCVWRRRNGPPNGKRPGPSL